jgi:metal-responsive CopG/Arc/MetJ family transcriptional regulator
MTSEQEGMQKMKNNIVTIKLSDNDVKKVKRIQRKTGAENRSQTIRKAIDIADEKL